MNEKIQLKEKKDFFRYTYMYSFLFYDQDRMLDFVMSIMLKLYCIPEIGYIGGLMYVGN